MDKENDVYPNNGILLSQKEGNSGDFAGVLVLKTCLPMEGM